MDEGRRRSGRLDWLNFEAKVHMKRSFFVKEWIKVYPFDYSRYGVGIQTDEAFEIGEQVILGIKLEKEGMNIEISQLRGLVRYKKKVHSRFDYGVEFCFESRLKELSMTEDLIKIETALQNYENSKLA